MIWGITMIFFQILAAVGQNFCYLIGNEKTKNAIVIDPSGEVKRILELVDDRDLKIKYIINTHAHSDHTIGNDSSPQFPQPSLQRRLIFHEDVSEI